MEAILLSDLLLAIDQGTSGCKLTIFDIDGNVVSNCTKVYHTYYPEENFVEQDCNEWWGVIVEGIKEMLEKDRIDPSRIKGIGVDGTSWACIPIDIEGNVLYPTMIWLDRRSKKQAEWMKDTIGEDILIEHSGNPVDPCYITPKILWIKENEPEIYKRTYKFLQSNAFIVYRLTGEVSQDYSQGYGFHFFNMKTGKYDQEIAKKLGISLDLMAPIRQCHEVVGNVTDEISALTGLVEGTPVVAGGLDAACCTLGAGVIEVGQTQEQGGQAGGMSIVVDHPLIHAKLILSYHVVPDLWLLQGGTTGGGGTLNWFNREFGYEEREMSKKEGTSSFEIMSREAQAIPAGSDGLIFLPFMKGERSPLWSMDAKGVYYGLGYEKTKAHMIRSTMEGVAYSLQHNLLTAEETGAIIGNLYSVGGSSNSIVWTQLKADVTGKKILVPYSDHSTALGAAILAGVGVGMYADFKEAIKRTVKIQRTHIPDENNRAVYEEQMQKYLYLSRLLMENMWTN